MSRTFKIDYAKIIKDDTDHILISKEHDYLLWDNEPILYIGKNSKNDFIIGSSVERDSFDKFDRFFHTIISESIYDKFKLREITYRDIILMVEEMYVIDISYCGEPDMTFKINPSDIPEEYLPTKDSYCPVEEEE